MTLQRQQVDAILEVVEKEKKYGEVLIKYEAGVFTIIKETKTIKPKV